MENVDYTRMSSKGQVVVPKSIRENLKLENGALFMIFADHDTLILKKVNRPQKQDLQEMFAKSRKSAQDAGLTKKDVDETIKAVRDEAGH